MNREYAIWIGAAALLTAGFFVGKAFMPAPISEAVLEGSAEFRAWFWENRDLDLVVQVGLVFAAALGIAALLPRVEEDEV